MRTHRAKKPCSGIYDLEIAAAKYFDWVNPHRLHGRPSRW
jgi:hypothetical protein